MEKYISQAIANDKYHVFKKEDNTSLCGRRMIINPMPALCSDFTGNEKFDKRTDCKTCFKKAGIKTD